MKDTQRNTQNVARNVDHFKISFMCVVNSHRFFGSKKKITLNNMVDQIL